MRTPRAIALILPWVCAVTLLTALADDDPAIDSQSEKDKRLEARVEESVTWYQLLPGADSRSTMHPQIVLRWLNAPRGQRTQDILVLWIHDGRPEAAATIFPRDGIMCHEFASLSRGGQLVAKDRQQVVWSPIAAGAEFRDVPNAPAPAGTPAGRLRQMKSLAERFQSTLTGLNADDTDREELRMLPRPVYRYEPKGTNASQPEFRDGAVLAFVQGTDPEVLLLLEAIGQNDRLRWQYAFARATSGGIEARLDGKVVWTAQKYPDDRSPTKPQITLRKAIME